MPRGDRDLLKADIEDGYGKVANLLIEALAFSKLNGNQISICLFIIRKSYCWDRKQAEVSLKEFAMACDTSESYISKQLKDLIKKNVVIRSNYQPGKTPTYSINTRVAQWDKGCINAQGLYECIRQGLYKCTKQGLYKCARVDSTEPLETVSTQLPLQKDLQKDITEINNGGIDNREVREKEEATTTENPMIKITQALQKAGILLPSSFEVEALLKWFDEGVELDVILLAITKAALSGNRKVNYIQGIIRDWNNRGLTTLEQVQAAELEFEQQKQRKAKSREPTSLKTNIGDSEYSGCYS